jgi:hypothetical protein
VEPHGSVPFDLESLSWDREMLQVLASVAADAWVTGGGHVYRPFFDNRFGPPASSWDVDVRVWGEQRANRVLLDLQERAAKWRWHVKDALSWSRKELSRAVASVEDSIGANALVCICAGIRWNGDRIQIHWGHPEAEADLRRGFLRPNPHGQLGFAQAKAARIISYYPGVAAPFVGHEPAALVLTYTDAMAKVSADEQGGRRRPLRLSLHERRVAARILRLRGSLQPVPIPVPWPEPAPFPDGDPWLAEDRTFRSWVVNQVRSRSPVGGRDSYLEHAFLVQAGGKQKPTHQGWSLHQHALHALLELDTDRFPEHRRAMRLAMLWHDVGKLWNVQTPGAHQRIGSRMWLDLQGDPLPGVRGEEERLVSCLIAHHDVFGRLERALWDDTFRGGVSPDEIRQGLGTVPVALSEMVGIARAMWLADVGSVPLLRWLRPLADELATLVSLGMSPHVARAREF